MQIFVAMPLGKKELELVRPTIRDAVNNAGLSVVFPDEIPGHGRIMTDVKDAISRSVAVIVEISSRNPNVVWEYGWATAIGKPTIPISNTKRSFFFDTMDNRAIVYDRNDIKKSLGQNLTVWCEKLRAEGPEFPPVDLVYSKKYSARSSAVFGINSISDSEFGLYDLMKIARHRIFAAAQNHNLLVTDAEQLKDAIESFFSRSGSSKRFDIMMSDPADVHGVQAWVSLSAPEYVGHLKQAATVLDEVASWAKSHRKIGERFRLRKVPFVPLSMNFVDPEARHGLLVLTPTFLKAESRGRHSLVVSRLNNQQIFDQYWSWASGTFTWRDAN